MTASMVWPVTNWEKVRLTRPRNARNGVTRFSGNRAYSTRLIWRPRVSFWARMYTENTTPISRFTTADSTDVVTPMVVFSRAEPPLATRSVILVSRSLLPRSISGRVMEYCSSAARRPSYRTSNVLT